jgi:hypothetical protein
MATIAELEAYMDKIEERYFALYPNPQEGQRGNWESIRGYIRRVKNGDIPGTTPETETPRATEAFVGFRRIMVKFQQRYVKSHRNGFRSWCRLHPYCALGSA